MATLEPCSVSTNAWRPSQMACNSRTLMWMFLSGPFHVLDAVCCTKCAPSSWNCYPCTDTHVSLVHLWECPSGYLWWPSTILGTPWFSRLRGLSLMGGLLTGSISGWAIVEQLGYDCMGLTSLVRLSDPIDVAMTGLAEPAVSWNPSRGRPIFRLSYQKARLGLSECRISCPDTWLTGNGIRLDCSRSTNHPRCELRWINHCVWQREYSFDVGFNSHSFRYKWRFIPWRCA